MKELGDKAEKHFDQFATFQTCQFMASAFTERKSYTEAAEFFKRQLKFVEKDLKEKHSDEQEEVKFDIHKKIANSIEGRILTIDDKYHKDFPLMTKLLEEETKHGCKWFFSKYASILDRLETGFRLLRVYTQLNKKVKVRQKIREDVFAILTKVTLEFGEENLDQ